MNTPASNTEPTAAFMAYRLAVLVSFMPGPGNADRDLLYRIGDLLGRAHPETHEALAEAQRAAARAIRPGHIERRPETWLLCGVVALLGDGIASAAAPALAATPTPGASFPSLHGIPIGAAC
jgi:hypothetical protein